MAAKWYRLAAHNAFRAMAEASTAKCLRKAALCYIEAKDMQMAAQTIQNCSHDEAATHYVHFLAYAYQGESVWLPSVILEFRSCAHGHALPGQEDEGSRILRIYFQKPYILASMHCNKEYGQSSRF